MSAARDILARAQAVALAFSPGSKGLEVTGPRGALTEELRSLILGHKPELLAILSGEADFLIHDAWLGFASSTRPGRRPT